MNFPKQRPRNSKSKRFPCIKYMLKNTLKQINTTFVLRIRTSFGIMLLCSAAFIFYAFFNVSAGDEQTVGNKLYSRDCQGDSLMPQNAEGKPDVGIQANVNAYYFNNSAYLTDATSSLICRSFFHEASSNETLNLSDEIVSQPVVGDSMLSRNESAYSTEQQDASADSVNFQDKKIAVKAYISLAVKEMQAYKSEPIADTNDAAAATSTSSESDFSEQDLEAQKSDADGQGSPSIDEIPEIIQDQSGQDTSTTVDSMQIEAAETTPGESAAEVQAALPQIQEGEDNGYIIEKVIDGIMDAVENLADLVSFTQAKAQSEAREDAQEKIFLHLYYSLDGEEWKEFAQISSDLFTEGQSQNQYSFDLPGLFSPDQLDRLQIKASRADGADSAEIYLDSIWLETQEKFLDGNQEENPIQALEGNKNFSLLENIDLKFRFNKGKRGFMEKIKASLGLGDYWSNLEVKAQILRANGEDPGLPAMIELGDNGELSVKAFRTKRKVKPGSYKALITIKDDSGRSIGSYSQDFAWGVLAFNTDKDAYLRGENAYLQIATLDDQGGTVCDSQIDIEVIAPSGEIDRLSTGDGTIARSLQCGPSTAASQPDYSANYILSQLGAYKFKISAIVAGKARSAEYIVGSADNREYEVERVSATRIFPKAPYQMFIKIRFDKDYDGDVYEFLPAGFVILSTKTRIVKQDTDESASTTEPIIQKLSEEDQALKWSGPKMEKGDQLIISYTYDAPDISPELYLIGPLQLKDYTEKRQWQIASDAVKTRAKTIMLLAGRYTGNGTTGQNSNTQQTYPSFDIELPEKDVDIKNAYVLFEARYDSYANYTTYTGYTIAFDASPQTETPSAFTGTSSISSTDSTILSYDETDSNQARLLADVTSEGQLDSYTGNGTVLKAQVGYQINRSAAANSISYTRAVLYLTYTYDASNSTTTANTIIYPLESNEPGYRGTLGVAQSDDCTLDVNCPTFGYNMDIAEYSAAGGSKKLSQWFEISQNNDTGGANDVNTTVNIQGDDRNSYTFYHEVGSLAEQGNFPTAVFNSVLGYSENSTQNLEVRSACAGASLYFMLGGEVFETYTASSSAGIKTRTASFPIGVVNNGTTNATTSASVSVYFPENGASAGVVTVKKAWLRIISNAYASGAASTSVATKVGNNATSTILQYAFNESRRIVNPGFYIINVLPSADYSALAAANAASSTTVTVSTVNTSNTLQGGLSAELMVTYTYANEVNGYLSSLNLFGGQSLVAPALATTTATGRFIAPEPAKKIIRGGALKTSFLFSPSDSSMPASGFIQVDANLSSAAPVCANAHRLSHAGRNAFGEFYRNVSSSLLTANNQPYNACMSNNGTSGASAKMNSQLIYTYQWENSAPSSTFAYIDQRKDGSGTVDISLSVYDPDANNARARLEFATGTACDFSNAQKLTLDTADASATSTYDDAKIDQTSYYQVGTTTGWIVTSSGANQVNFDWKSGIDLPDADADYCLRAVANDMALSQETPATTTITIDNKAPTAPGTLGATSTRATSSVIIFGATSTETHFKEYIIYYKVADGTAPTEADMKIGSTTDANLLSKTFNSATSTTILTLTKNTTYAFSIWAYDTYGHKSSSSVYQFTTNEPPTGSINSIAQKGDGSGVFDISIEVNDYNDSDICRAKIIMATGTTCDFSGFSKPALDANTSNIQADFGTPQINNSGEYQVGNSSGWIKTSPGSNTVNFDWFSLDNIGAATGTYCFKLVVNDGLDDQLDIATATTSVDNVPPSVPGALTIDSITQMTAKLIFGAQSWDDNFSRYKIFYKIGTSGVSETDTELIDTDLNSVNYGGTSSTTAGGLVPNTYYAFNIWAYDLFGNKSASTEVYERTNATIVNDSLTFMDPTSSNYAVAEAGNIATFRAVVSETNGYLNLASTTLRLADASDSVSPFNDLSFIWYQTSQTFAETGSDAMDGAAISPNSSSTCAGNTCTIDFKIIFNHKFTDSSTDYSAELYSVNDSNVSDEDSYSDFYQVKAVQSRQMHYRWRNDDGTE